MAEGFASGALAKDQTALQTVMALEAGLETEKETSNLALLVLVAAYKKALILEKREELQALGPAIAEVIREEAQKLDRLLTLRFDSMRFAPKGEVSAKVFKAIGGAGAGAEVRVYANGSVANPSRDSLELSATSGSHRSKARKGSRKRRELESEGRISYVLDVHEVADVAPNQFKEQLMKLMEGKKVVSFGEEHDMNQDESFSDILEFQDLILVAYHHLPRFRNWDDFLDAYKKDFGSQIVDDFISFRERVLSASRGDIIHQNASRIFALIVLPLAKRLGFTHLVMEGLYEGDPQRSIPRSKDQIGMLLVILMSLIHGVQIRGAYSEDFLQPGVDVARALGKKVNVIFGENPEARVLTYNGAIHSMTKPMRGVQQILGPIRINLRDLTFAPSFQRRWGRRFLAIDLVTQHTSQPDFPSPFSVLRKEAGVGVIRKVRHSRGQIAFVFPKE